MMIGRTVNALVLLSQLALGGCALLDDSAPRKPESTGLIATPPGYYSTSKARYLGTKYKENLDRIVERITRNSKTASLQFANNISSVGGIGFFTHSATKSGDERYLEVVLATPETFEAKGEFSEKVQRLFTRYGLELLGITSGDSDIYQDRELSGYGLNLAWRNIVAERAGNRVSLERAIIYFTKERVRNFIRQELSPNELLSDAVIFAVEDDGPLNLVSFRPQESQRDFRPAIREDNLAASPVVPTAGEILVETVKPAPANAAERAAPIAKSEIASPVAAPVVTQPEPVGKIVQAPRQVEAQPIPAPSVVKANETVKPEPVKLAAPLPAAAKAEARAPQDQAKAQSAKAPPAPKQAADAKLPEAIVAPAPAVKMAEAEPAAPVEIALPAARPNIAKVDSPRVVEVKPLTPAHEKPAGEQLTLLKNKPAEVAPAKPEVARSAPKAPKALEGFIIQLAFNDKEKAQRWAEAMEKRGYAVSLTEAGGEGSLRVRLGNFSVRDEAERQLRTLKQDGLSGIVISLPQAFRPEARTSIP
jgi:DedD protein